MEVSSIEVEKLLSLAAEVETWNWERVDWEEVMSTEKGLAAALDVMEKSNADFWGTEVDWPNEALPLLVEATEKLNGEVGGGDVVLAEKGLLEVTEKPNPEVGGGENDWTGGAGGAVVLFLWPKMFVV